MTKTYQVGDVLVIRGDAKNPYRAHNEGQGVFGDERVSALQAWVAGTPDPQYTYWYGPVSGGARRLEPGDEIRGMG